MWVGWVTPDYHMYDPSFDLTKVRNVTITVGDDRGNIHDRSVFIANLYSDYQLPRDWLYRTDVVDLID